VAQEDGEHSSLHHRHALFIIVDVECFESGASKVN